MKPYQFFFRLLMVVSIAACNNNTNTTSGPKEPADGVYNSAADAAAAAKQDMLTLMETDSLPLGFDPDTLSAAVAGTPIPGFNIDLKHIINSQTITSFDSLPKGEFPVWVPFIKNNSEVVTVVGINRRDSGYVIGQLVNQPLALNLRQVMAMNTKNGDTLQWIVQIYSIQSTVFVARKADSMFYYFDFNHDNIPTRALSGKAMLDTLKKESEFFINRFGNNGKEVYW